MNGEFVEYLKSVGMGEKLIERVTVLNGICSSLFPETIIDIFVSEYLKEDGVREYESLWFFGKNYSSEFSGFITEEDFDIFDMKGNILGVEFKSKNYDFKEANDNSRLSVFFHECRGTALGILKASKKNCDNLRKISQKYLIPNVRE